MRYEVIISCLLGVASVGDLAASDRLDALLATDPAAEARRAFAAGDKAHIVPPVCESDGGEVIPGWPLENSRKVQRAMEAAKRPVTCADFGEDPKKEEFGRVTKYAERYNRTMLNLEEGSKK